MTALATELNKAVLPHCEGKDWDHRSISYMLTNERYIGDSLWQKTYMTDALPPRHLPNKGQKPKYYAKATHPAIIDQDLFAQVQELIDKRRKKYSQGQPCTAHPLRRKIVCGQCGTVYRKKVVRGITYWRCPTHDMDSNQCPISQTPETEIQEAFLRLYYKLRHQGLQFLAQMLTDLQTIRSRRMLWSTDIIELNKKISSITSQSQLLAMLKQQGGVDPDIFIARSNELAEQLRAAKQEKERLLNRESDDTIAQTKDLIEVLETGPEFLGAFDRELFGELVDRIIVESNERLRFRLKNGLELAETIERTVR